MTDREWMEQALALGALGDAATSPNPRVGCVVVRQGEVVGCGYHRAAGLPHAEALALAAAGGGARGATLYVNLEPCAHEGRTPPCAHRIAQAGISRVVASIQDPNPLVDGRGFAHLRAAGIAVDIGLLATESRRLNDAFHHFHRHGRPLVTLKGAISLDGMLAAAAGHSRWISGAASRRFAQRLRARNDAVLIGAGTLRRDDPRLTIRLPGLRATRWRCVLAPRLEIDPEARLFHCGAAESKPRLYVADDVPRERVLRFDGLAEIVRVRRSGERIALDDVLRDLAFLGVQSLLVEGGALTHAGFLEAGRADRLALFIARKLLGGRGGTPLLDRTVVQSPALAWRLGEVRQLALGGDLALVGRLRAPRPAEG